MHVVYAYDRFAIGQGVLPFQVLANHGAENRGATQAAAHPNLDGDLVIGVYIEFQANVMRLGLGLYGIPTNAPRDARLGLKPALEMTSLISSVKKVPRGALIGYSSTFEAPKDMTIATIPAGYNEGIDRRLSNEGTVKVAQFVCRIIGRVSMNITTIDISHLPAHLMKIGTPVILISADPRDANSIAQMADRANASPYELLVHIPAGLRRVVK